MRFAYADPPYPGQAKRLYGKHQDYAGEVDHGHLVGRLVSDYPDGWALSTGSKMLAEVLALCPAGTRVMAWCKPNGPKFNVSLQFWWEPVLVCGGRPRPKNAPALADYLVHPPEQWTREARADRAAGVHVIGQKPRVFCRWVFEALGAQRGDTLDDLFPGSGAVGREWDAWSAQPQLGDVA